ncbi:MAG: AI-2E family transporter [Alphaproteobacteria bacterium]|nr:AI-2E family transporter [Alphaproteobacteria bacterium]
MRKDSPITSQKNNIYRLWAVLACILIAVTYVFFQISSITFPFIAGLLGAYIFNKPVAVLERAGVPRALSAGLLIFCVLLFLGLLLLEALPFLKDELIKLVRSYPVLQERFVSLAEPIIDYIHKIAGDHIRMDLKTEVSNSMGKILQWVVESLAGMLTTSLTNGLAIANIISLVFLIPFIMFYALTEWPKILKTLDSLLPKKYAHIIRHNVINVDKRLGDYARGQLLVCSVLILLYSCAFLLIQLPHALFTGFITGFFSFIPYVGVFIGFILAMAIALSNFSDLYQIIAVIAIYGLFITIDGYFLTPRLIGDRIGMHPAFIIFALLALGSWFGFLGIMFALPVAAVVSALLIPFIAWYKENFT